MGNEYENHAWFVGYAPADDPRVAVAVLVEHGGHGGSFAGPLARRVIAAALTEPQPRVANPNKSPVAGATVPATLGGAVAGEGACSPFSFFCFET